MTTTGSAPPSPVTVLGLGAMGRALARAFLDAGHPTTVWNRTPGRAAAVDGAVEAADPAAAAGASPLVVLCVLDAAASGAVLDAAATALVGRVVVDLTSGTPDQARATAARIASLGARPVAGTVMVPTPLVGTPDASVLYAGDADAFAEVRPVLAALGGEQEHLGPDPGRAALFDLGMLGMFFTGMTSFLHAAALVGTDGVAASAFVPYARTILGLLDGTVAQLAGDVDAGTYPGEEDNLRMELTFLEHIVEASRERGIEAGPVLASLDLAAAAVAAGHGPDGYSRLVELLRPTG